MSSEPENEGSASGGGNWAAFIPSVISNAIGLLNQVGMFSSNNKMEELQVQVRDQQRYIYQMKVKELENLLVERQHMFCSSLLKQKRRKQLEDHIKEKAENLEDLVPDIQSRLRKIFSHDHSCGSRLNYILTRDKTQNGRLMWDELEEWRRRARNVRKGCQEP